MNSNQLIKLINNGEYDSVSKYLSKRFEEYLGELREHGSVKEKLSDTEVVLINSFEIYGKEINYGMNTFFKDQMKYADIEYIYLQIRFLLWRIEFGKETPKDNIIPLIGDNLVSRYAVIHILSMYCVDKYKVSMDIGRELDDAGYIVDAYAFASYGKLMMDCEESRTFLEKLKSELC